MKTFLADSSRALLAEIKSPVLPLCSVRVTDGLIPKRSPGSAAGC